MEPLTLTGSAYKRIRTISNTLNNITDVVAMGGDVRQDLIRNLLIQLSEQVLIALEQLEEDMERLKRKQDDAIANRSSHGRHVDPT